MSEQDWFIKIYQEVIKSGLCSGCGTCIGLSGGALSFDPVKGIPVYDKGAMSVEGLSDFRTAYFSCPGRGLNYPELHRSCFGSLPDNWFSGHVRRSYIGFSKDEEVRRKGASGGAITQILIRLLETHEVDGVITIRQQTDKPWLTDPVLVTQASDLIFSAQSIYFPVPVNAALSGIPEGEGRFAYVGLPDQVASLRSLQRAGNQKANQIKWVFGPYMGINMSFEAIISFLRSNGVKNYGDITYLRFRDGEWPGHLKIITRDGRIITAPKFYYNYLLPFFITNHSRLSVDFTNELCDISVGDAWHPKFEKEGKGFSVILARSIKGEKTLNKLSEVLSLEEIPLDEALDMHGHMIDFKKRGSFIRIEWRKALGMPAPVWGYEPVSLPLSRKMVEVVISTIFFICRWPVSRWIIGRIPVKLVGPVFDTLRKSWKNVSKPTKRKGLRETTFRVMKNEE